MKKPTLLLGILIIAGAIWFFVTPKRVMEVEISNCEQSDLITCFGSGRTLITRNEHGEFYNLISSDTSIRFGVIRPEDKGGKFYQLTVYMPDDYKPGDYKEIERNIISNNFITCESTTKGGGYDKCYTLDEYETR